MEVTYTPAIAVYGVSSLSIPADKEIPTAIWFPGLEDLGPDYVKTPMDELFRHCVQRLQLPFRGALMYLPRSTEMNSLPKIFPPRLAFTAYKGGLPRMPDGVSIPKVDYYREVTHITAFDGLELGTLSMEDLERKIKKKPMGEKIEIFLGVGSISLQDGYNPVASLAHALKTHEESAYVTTRRLTLEPKGTPWFKIGKIQKDLGDITAEESVEEVKEILEKALEAERHGFLF